VSGIPGDPAPDERTLIHASAVSVSGRGLLILGPSGAGKSSLALQLVALGAQLVSDDQTWLRMDGETLIAEAPQTLDGLIEARGLGILRLASAGPTPLVLAVDLAQAETERMPPARRFRHHSAEIDLVFGQTGSQFPASLLLYMKSTEPRV
jgi:HPr kinase/phosphorylase